MIFSSLEMKLPPYDSRIWNIVYFAVFLLIVIDNYGF